MPSSTGQKKQKKTPLCDAVRKELDSLVAQMVKNLPTMQETRVRSLGGEDPLEKGMECQPALVFLPGEFHGQRSLSGYCSRSCKQSDTTE